MHHAPVASDAKHTVAVFVSKGARLRPSVTDGGYSHHCLPVRSLCISQIIQQRNRTNTFPASLKEMPSCQWAAHAWTDTAGTAAKERFNFPPGKHAPPRKLQIPTTQKGTEQLRVDRLRSTGTPALCEPGTLKILSNTSGHPHSRRVFFRDGDAPRRDTLGSHMTAEMAANGKSLHMRRGFLSGAWDSLR